MPQTKFRFGQSVLLQWGLSEVRGRVQRVYGEGSALRIVVALDPEESEWIVDEPTTVAVLADEVRLAPPAA